MKVISSRRDLDDACSQVRALVFLWVDWSIEARHSEHALTDLLQSWARAFPDRPIPVYRADLSGQIGEIWDAIREWLRAEGQDADGLTLSGNGALLWLRQRKVAAAVGHLAAVDHEQRLAICRRVWQQEPFESNVSGF